ncbi:MAG: imidazole glycerol phosphate synthase subunit HisH [Candidatus Methanolliviera hydrocarbonicum]|uniref:Imidazole glycerol phosphate synthase subunit HisH n=1 Tax=Candidatus Methanolliviera hydrocarbonicum TaxID=2491085 RepID=A0A520KXL7_9EURY|nr:MAG: imidazole glycerol phosphate synthase subunit HisH [Candidatus Methanolliviera hydrocarbonicum]
MAKKIAIIDYSLGNLRSIKKGFEKVGAEPFITNDDRSIKEADGIVLPGVGAFKSAMGKLEGKESVIYELIDNGKPILGICLGMQILVRESTEGGLIDGLKIIPGRVIKFDGEEMKDLKIPHMGWNNIKINVENPLFEGMKRNYFYFVHSYYVQTDERYVLAESEYGKKFAASIFHPEKKIYGTQFHPEKSGEDGIKVLSNFLEMC